MYVARQLRSTLQQALSQFPAILVTGPRQSGKTTFLRHELGESHAYYSLDDPIESDFARNDPNGFLDRVGDRPAVIDEIQYAPDLMRHIKLRIDQQRHVNGRWVLTGSQQFALMQHVSESLAGRIAVLELLPFSSDEQASLRAAELDELIWLGSYPDPFIRPETRDLWLRSYLRTYLERDVRNLLKIADLHAFETLTSLAASRHAQQLNYAALGREVGRTQQTVKAWCGVMEASYFIHLVPPYFRNFGKRLVKTPKLYFLDSGIVCTLTRQPGAAAALAGAMGGALFEGWVVSEAAKVFTDAGRRPSLYFWRSHDGLEIDLLVEAAGKLVPIEIKLTATPNSRHTQCIERLRTLAKDVVADDAALLCRIPTRRELPGGVTALPWQQFYSWLRNLVVSAG